MALIIEDGTIVDGANSFATAAELVTYADEYGLTIPATAAEQERLLRRAALQMQALSWKGEIVSAAQPLSWPRTGWSGIPPAIKNGQMALAAEIYADDQSPATDAKGPIMREKVGPLETEYGAAQSWQLKPAATKQSYANFGPYLQAANQVRLARG